MSVGLRVNSAKHPSGPGAVGVYGLTARTQAGQLQAESYSCSCHQE